jgi:hypothetical protein
MEPTPPQQPQPVFKEKKMDPHPALSAKWFEEDRATDLRIARAKKMRK